MGRHISRGSDCARHVCASHGVANISANTGTDSGTHGRANTRADANPNADSDTEANGATALHPGLCALVHCEL